MFYGKPVIAAPYSGNRDFFNLNNGLPVRYDLVELGEHAGPYPAGSRWAEPDIDHAAEQMRRLVDDAALRQRLGERARRDIRQQLSVEAVAQILRQRFDDIVGRVGRAGARVPGLE
jgi:glycosyltransferase involved in cell wall biosynthesis